MKAICAGIAAASQIPMATMTPRGESLPEQLHSSQAFATANLLNFPFSLLRSFPFFIPRKSLTGKHIHPISGCSFKGTAPTDKSFWKSWPGAHKMAFGVCKFWLGIPSHQSQKYPRCQADSIMQQWKPYSKKMHTNRKPFKNNMVGLGFAQV